MNLQLSKALILNKCTAQSNPLLSVRRAGMIGKSVHTVLDFFYIQKYKNKCLYLVFASIFITLSIIIYSENSLKKHKNSDISSDEVQYLLVLLSIDDVINPLSIVSSYDVTNPLFCYIICYLFTIPNKLFILGS